jgi:protoporphyrinogen oxidase
VSLNWKTISNLGLKNTIKIGLSYFKASAKPIDPEKSLEDFFINRFGRELYLTFFKDYTEKVWGVPCDQINADWGAQRIKGLSIKKALTYAVKEKRQKTEDLAQKELETSLIGQFMYPKHGPGQMWEEVAQLVTAAGGSVNLLHRVVGIETEEDRVQAVLVKDEATGENIRVEADYFFSPPFKYPLKLNPTLFQGLPTLILIR